jgi:hypothetical protein
LTDWVDTLELIGEGARVEIATDLKMQCKMWKSLLPCTIDGAAAVMGLQFMGIILDVWTILLNAK